jgi:hypothetical protein
MPRGGRDVDTSARDFLIGAKASSRDTSRGHERTGREYGHRRLAVAIQPGVEGHHYGQAPLGLGLTR